MPPWMMGCSISNISVILVFMGSRSQGRGVVEVLGKLVRLVREGIASAGAALSALKLGFAAFDERADAFLGVFGAHHLGMDRGNGGNGRGLGGLDILQRRLFHGTDPDRRVPGDA